MTSRLTPQQQIAITHPCQRGIQCANQRYRRVIPKGKYLVSIVVTVNVGDE